MEVVVTTGQGWTQIGELALALVLCAAIGMERELRQKAAGLRTLTLVGVGSALFMIVGKYGFADVIAGSHISLDPSRVAAQIVTGIGFIGGGLIFVRRDAVRGLTTAAVVWVTAAVGMACGGGLWLLALIVTGGHFIVTQGFQIIGRRVRRPREGVWELRLSYEEGAATLREALARCADRGFTISQVSVNRYDYAEGDRRRGTVSAVLRLRGRGSLAALAEAVSDVPGVLSITSEDLAEE